MRKETTLSLKRIAQHLEMRSWIRVSNLLGARSRKESTKSEDLHEALKMRKFKK